MSLKNNVSDMKEKTKIIFLDRDGTLNYLRSDYVKNLKEFELLPNIGKHLSRLSKANFKLIIITNQSAINRGLLNIEELTKIHAFLINFLEKQGCTIDEICFCPHTPQENCNCRKPKTGLFENIIEKFTPVDLDNCWIIGDSQSDIDAGHSLNINTFKIDSDSELNVAVDYILSKTAKIT